ncbi:MAG: hypothetical protein M3N19_00570 [Candidatus Eremiobacteraeota bacterium]|nr:hypothetical protein [Candidatus Eremiobacteraeota bacterium]
MLQPAESALRPRNVGEILDRAVTIYVRNFVTFTVIALFFFLPLSVLEYFTQPDAAAAYAQLGQQLSSVRTGHPVASPPQSPTQRDATFVILALSIGLAPLLSAAGVLAVERTAHGIVPEWRACWRLALARWLSIVGITLLELLAIALTVVVGFLGIVFGAVFAALALRGVPALGIFLMVLVGAIGLVWFLILLMQAILCFAFGVYAVTVERVGVGRAFASSFSRVFNRANIGRAALITLAVSAVDFGVLLISVFGQALLSSTFHSHALDSLFGLLVGLTLSSFVSVFVAVYYFDVRTRVEGLDLQPSIESIQGGLSPT